jgi:predicted CoA-substrate-specific enzyme activase
MKQEYSKWPESRHVESGTDWKTAGRITAGIDVGTTSTQAVVLSDNQKILGYSNIRTGRDFGATANEAFRLATEGSSLERRDFAGVTVTGFGKRNVDFADKAQDEILCHAKGARYMFGPEVFTVVDLGGQTCKAIHLHNWDRVRGFEINDKCATGMGRDIETLCDLLMIPIEKIGELSLDVKLEPEPVSTTCLNFARTETLGLFRPVFREEPLTENEIYASYIFAIAWRIMGVIGKLQPLAVGDLSIFPKLAFTGGLAKNPGITQRIERDLGVTALTSEIDPMLAGALGAALLAG